MLVTQFRMLVPEANVKRYWMLMAKIKKTVTNILKLPPTHFVSNIGHQHRCSRSENISENIFVYVPQ